MKFSKNSIRHIAPRLGATALLAAFLGGCQLPPAEVLRGIQQETLVGYFARDRVAPLYENRGFEASPRREIASLRPRSSSGLPGGPPVARWDLAHPQYVVSPFAPANSLVDVSALQAGEVARCPFTGKKFIVPEPRSSTEIARSSETPSQTVANGSRPDFTPRTPSLPKPMREPDLVVVDPLSDAVEPIETPPMPKPSPSAPYAQAVAGKPGFVRSPFTDDSKLVDVAGLAPGTTVRCPYTGKQFLVPESAPAPAPGAPASEPSVSGGNGAPMLGSPKPKSQPKADPNPTEPDLEPAPAEKKDGEAETGGESPVPYAKRADGKSGYVTSPYGNYLVDVRGKTEGSVTRCPFTGKLFKVPAE